MKTPIRLYDTAGVVAAVPVLLGFHPTDSLVLIFLEDTRIGLTVRVDLCERGQAQAYALDLAARLLVRGDDGADGVLLITVGPDARTDVIDAVAEALAARGVTVRAKIWAQGTTAGSRYTCVDGCHDGYLPDPRTTDLGLATSVDSGRTVQASREAIAESMAPTVDAQTMARRLNLIKNEAGMTPDVAAIHVCDALSDVHNGRLHLDDWRVAALARSLMTPKVPDLVIGWALTSSLDDAHELWLALTREFPAPCRADAAALLALTAMVKGDGAVADAALAVAEEAAPGHVLTVLVRRMHGMGMSPRQIREALTTVLEA
jgi:hypothetical protein